MNTLNVSTNYYAKYLKYKTKYVLLKKQKGGDSQFKNIKYLGQGAENYAFQLEHGQILRIRKNCERLGESENNVLTELAGKTIKHFIKVFSKGNCFDLRDKLSDQVTEFCELNNLETASLCNYDYVIMNNAEGTNLLNYTTKTFSEQLQLPDINVIDKQLITNHKKLLINFFQKITIGLIDANTQLNGFKHKDLNYRNCYIDINLEPIIFDFGASLIGFGSIETNSSDILDFITDILSDSTIDTNEFAYGITTFKDLSKGEKDIIKSNYYKLTNMIRSDEQINQFIIKYFNENKTSFGGIRLSIKLNVTLDQINQDLLSINY